MKYVIQAKPTMFLGRMYRSRLEARWAAFFKLMNYNVEYEPCDFIKWSPDFLLTGQRHTRVYIEVKPYIEIETIKEYYKRINESGLFLDPENHFASTNKFIICSDIHLDDSKVLFGYEILPGCQIDEIYFKNGFDLSSYTYDWDGWLTNYGNDHSHRKYFLYSEYDSDAMAVLNTWNKAANLVRFFKD